MREEASLATQHLAELEREIAALEREMTALGARGDEVPEELAERYDRERAAFEFAGGFERAARVERVLAGLGFAASELDRPLASFSGGWRMRVELAKLLLGAPDVLLLDEPTNHLDLPSIQWFEETLAEYRGGAIVISHDRAFLRRHANRMAELERGSLVLFEGGFDRYQQARAERLEHLRARQRQEQREVAEVERFIERFRYKASKARQVQSRIKALEKRERIDLPEPRARAMRLRIPEPRRSGESVLALRGVHKRYGDKTVYAGVELALRRGERVALVGPNGAGKSTLLRIAAGVLRDGRRRAHARPQRRPRVLRAAPARVARPAPQRARGARVGRGDRRRAAPARPPRRVPVLGRRRREEGGGAVGRGEGAPRARQAAVAPAQLPRARRAHQSPRRRVVRGARGRAARLHRHDAVHLARPRFHRRAGHARGGGARGSAALVSGELLGVSASRSSAARNLRRPTPAAADRPRRPRTRSAIGSPRASARRSARAGSSARASGSPRSKRTSSPTRSAIEELTRELAEPDVYSDGDFVRATLAERDEVRAAIDARYADWEAIAAEIESLERAAPEPPR